MSNLIKSDVQDCKTTSLTPIEIVLGIDGEGRTTAKKLYEFLELNPAVYSRWCNEKIIKNEFAEENRDYEVLNSNVENPQGGRPSQDYKLSASFAKKLAMGTHNIRGEAAKIYFIKVEDKLKKQSIAINELSPSLQMFKQIFDTVAKQELEHKKLKQEVIETKNELQGIRTVIEIKPSESWRNETNSIVKKICYKISDYSKPKDEIYKALQERGACDLKRRLDNMRARILLNGGSKSKANDLNFLDVIAEDKKLVEIYTAIVKEMAIKYKVA